MRTRSQTSPSMRTTPQESAGAPRFGPWLTACLAAETIGMTASAAAARLSTNALEGTATTGDHVRAWLLVIGGGLVEGTALGLLQARALDTWLPRKGRRRWAVVTLCAAGLGWAAASAPSAFASDSASSGSEPPAAVMLLGAAGLGIVMGAVLGGAQASVLRPYVRHPGRWVTANVTGWAVAMPVIFIGAMSPGESWPTVAVAGLGAVTGAAAGTVLGAVTGAFLPRVDADDAGDTDA